MHDSTQSSSRNWITGQTQAPTPSVIALEIPSKVTLKKESWTGPRRTRVSDVLFTAETLPDSISGTYVDDYDILHVHDVVMYKLGQERHKIKRLQETKDRLLLRLNDSLKAVERRKAIAMIVSLDEDIGSLSRDDRKRVYVEESATFLDRYRSLGPIIRVKTFASSDDVAGETKIISTDIEERLGIIRGYLDIAKKYIPLNVIRIIPNDRSCLGCGQELTTVDPEESTMERCNDCGFERLNFAKPFFSKDPSNPTKIASASDYEDRKNFIKGLECYLGEQQAPPPSVFKRLKEWDRKYNHPPGDVIAALPVNPDGTRGNYGKSMLLQALADEGYAEYYKDVKLIGHLHWGWKLPSVSQQDRDVIINDYDVTQKIFRNIPKDRKSSLNTQYRLYRHLQARGIPCQPTDFKLPTTPSILEEQDNYWREMIVGIDGAVFTSLK